ncbi:MAG: hypothetical protein ACOCXZ_02995 [Chloroflexota bacterium]
MQFFRARYLRNLTLITGLLLIVVMVAACGGDDDIADPQNPEDVVDIIAGTENPQVQEPRPDSPYATSYATDDAEATPDEAAGASSEETAPGYEVAVSGAADLSFSAEDGTFTWDYEEPSQALLEEPESDRTPLGLYTLRFAGPEDNTIQVYFTDNVTEGTFFATTVPPTDDGSAVIDVYAEATIDDTSYTTTTDGELTLSNINTDAEVGGRISGSFSFELESPDDGTVTVSGDFAALPVNLIPNDALDETADEAQEDF